MTTPQSKSKVDLESIQELTDEIQRLQAELAADGEEQVLEEVILTNEEMDALTEEQLQAQVDLLAERIEHLKKQVELNRRAINLGLLRIANQAPRCSHVKANGEPCRAPALREKLFCIFHSRALETNDGPGMHVRVLEDHESVQLTVKQVMEKVVSGHMSPQTASLLLRAMQIANSALHSKAIERREPGSSRKTVQSEAESGLGNAEECSA